MDNLNYKDNIGSMEVTNCNGFIRLCFTFNSTMLSGMSEIPTYCKTGCGH